MTRLKMNGFNKSIMNRCAIFHPKKGTSRLRLIKQFSSGKAKCIRESKVNVKLGDFKVKIIWKNGMADC